VAGLLALAPISLMGSRGDPNAEQDRLQNAGKVMEEVLRIPDDIPRDLLSKTRCVIVIPSVLKAAFIAGGSYGRGMMR
jgi:SH3 domain-containing YSC84-like protein 1